MEPTNKSGMQGYAISQLRKPNKGSYHNAAAKPKASMGKTLMSGQGFQKLVEEPHATCLLLKTPTKWGTLYSEHTTSPKWS